jgi:hypothetical protein
VVLFPLGPVGTTEPACEAVLQLFRGTNEDFPFVRMRPSCFTARSIRCSICFVKYLYYYFLWIIETKKYFLSRLCYAGIAGHLIGKSHESYRGCGGAWLLAQPLVIRKFSRLPQLMLSVSFLMHIPSGDAKSLGYLSTKNIFASIITRWDNINTWQSSTYDVYFVRWRKHRSLFL